MSNSLAPIIKELERAYRELTTLFTVEVWDPSTMTYEPAPMLTEDPVITIQRRGKRRKEWGWYTPASWQSTSAAAFNVLSGKPSDKPVSEITIAAEGLHRSTREILITLLHQMVHHANALRGIKDGKAGYHNAHFKHQASIIGLYVVEGETGGYSKEVGVSERIEKLFEKIALDESVFDLYRREEASTNVNPGSPLKKWSCACTNIRAATIVHAICQKCNQYFVYTDNDPQFRLRIQNSGLTHLLN